MEVAFFLLVWLSLCFVAATIAKQKGRNEIGFLFLTLFLSPLVGILAALVAETNVAVVEARQIASEKYKRCSRCAEIVKAEANICKHCHRDCSSPNPIHPTSTTAAS